jgi:site-specific recombinase XerD
MVGRRKKTFAGWQPRLYEYKGKWRRTFYTITALNERINLGHDLIEAKKALLKLEEGRSIAGTIGALLNDYLAIIRAKVEAGKRSVNTYTGNLLEVVQLKKAFGKMSPAALRTSHVWTYLHKARGKEAPVRANREIALLQAAFNYATNAGIVDRNPCIGAERNEETPRDRYVDDAELKAFIAFAKSGQHLKNDAARKWSDAGLRLALAAELAYLTGKGQAQILRLSKTQLKDEGIEFAKRKRGARTLVTWTPELRRVVAECQGLPRDIDTIYLLCNRAGQPYTSSGFKAMWSRLQVAWAEEGNEHFHFHDLRAKAVTDVIEQGRKASELTGHRTEDMPAKIYDRRAIRKSPAVK